MALTLEQVNAIRARTGQEPLTELPVEQPAAPVVSEEEKLKAEEEAKNKNKQPANPAPASIPEVDEQAVLKFLGERGISVSSINDLNKPTVLTEADLEKQKEQRENEKLTFGLNKGLFNRKTHEQFILDRNNKQDLVYAHYHAEAKKEDPELTDEDIQAEFAEKYGLSSEANTRKHKRGQQEINLLGDLILRNKYANIYKLDSEYDAHEATANQQRDFENKVKLQAPAYKKDVDDIFSELKKITTKIGENEEYEVEVMEDALTQLKSDFLNANYVAEQIKQGYTKEKLKEIAFTALLSQQWPVLAKKMIDQALLNHQKGVRGIVPVNPSSKEGASELSELQQKIMKRTFPNQQPVIAN